MAFLLQVLPTSTLQTLLLNTNTVGDEGAEILARAIAGGHAALAGVS